MIATSNPRRQNVISLSKQRCGRMMRSLVARCVQLLVAAIAIVCPSRGDAADEPTTALVAGWIERDRNTGEIPQRAYRVARRGQVLSPGQVELQPCDEVELLDAAATVRILLPNRSRIVLDPARPNVHLPCDSRDGFSIPVRLAKLWRSILGYATADAHAVSVSTRTAPLSVPALGNYSPRLAGGKRAVYVTWVGGEAPFSVRITSFKTNAIVAQANGIERREVSLPVAEYGVGRYVLEVRDARGARIREPDLQVGVPSEVPPPPAELTDARDLSASERQLLYAYFLEGESDGRWTLEALQLASRLDTSTPIVKQWLQRFGGDD